MPTIWTLLRATAIVGGSAAALLAGGIAHADPAAPLPVPDIAGPLASSVANAPQLLQGLASALGGAPSTPPPLATAGIQVPQSAAAAVPGAASALPGAASLIPGASSLVPGATAPASPMTPTAPGATSLIPGLTPTAATPTTGIPGLTPTASTAPAAGASQLLPQAQLNLPQLPFSPVPLPQHLSLPGDLASLANGGVPASPTVPGAVPVSAPGLATAPSSTNPFLFPLSALP